MPEQYLIALITVPSEETGRKIARHLLEQKLAACVNIIPGVRSMYVWKGEIQDEAEALLVVKTRSELFSEHLVPALKAVHPYEVPEIIALPVVSGSVEYLKWIEEVTSHQ